VSKYYQFHRLARGDRRSSSDAGPTEQTQEIARLVSETEDSYQKIADRFGLTRSRVGQIAVRMGVARGGSGA
jgi:uncharacterized protein YdbL (DUF1318 family)